MYVVNHVYPLYKLYDQLKDLEANAPEGRTADWFVENVLPKFGIVTDNQFIVLWNDHSEGYNSGIEVMAAADLYFGTTDTYLNGYGYQYGASAYEVLDELGVTYDPNYDWA